MNDIIYTIDGFDKEKTILENIMALKVEAEAISDKLDIATKDKTILTIADKLQSIIDSVTDIQAAILAKGATITGSTKLSDYDTAINTILQEPTLIAPIADNADVLSGKHYNDKSGLVQTGTMPDNSSTGNALIWIESPSMTIPKGYHDGTKTVYITPEEKTATPTEATQNITPMITKVLSKVTVNPIPTNYKNTTGTDAVAAEILSGKKACNTTGQITGTMPDNSSTANTVLWGDVPSMTIPKGYHDGTKTVYITPEEKTVTPTESAQDVTPSLTKLLTKVTVNAIPSSYKKYATGSCTLLTAMYTLNAISLSFQPTILILKAPSVERYVVAVYIGSGTSTVMQITNYSSPNMTVAFSSVSDLFTSSGVAGGIWAVEDSSYFSLTGWTYYAFKT